MALSGSWNQNVGAGWRLRLEWSATQNISANTSNVTVRLYWVSLGSSYTVRSTASKTASIGIGGTWNNKTASNLAALNGNQKKLIHTYSRTIAHRADGTQDVSLGGWFNANVTLSGVYYGRVQVASRTVTLNRIPRNSSISSSASWTAGSNRSVSISRASSSFRHRVRWQVQDSGGTWRTVRTVENVGSSNNGSFSTSQNRDIFNRLSQRSSTPSRIALETYSGSTKIGSTVYKTGTCTAPTSSTTTRGSSFNIGSTISGSISRKNSSFTHTLQLRMGGSTYTMHTRTSSTSWSYNTSSIASSLYSKIPSAKSLSGELRIYTYYDGVQVRSHRTYSITANVTNSNPSFNSSAISYEDTNSVTIGVTGNNRYIVQNMSNLRVIISTGATPRNSASIREYVITCGNRSVKTSSIGNVNLGTINASSNTPLSVRVVDSRGFSTTVSVNVNILPYQSPTVRATAERLNGFESSTTVSLRGSISALRIGSTNRNSVQRARYRYRQQGVGSYSSFINFSVTQNIPNYTGANRTLILNNIRAWDVSVEVTDRLGTTTVNLVVPVGQPVLFIDSGRSSVGVNKFPTRNNSFEITGDMRMDGGQIISSTESSFTTETGDAKLIARNGHVIIRSHTGRAYVQGSEVRFVEASTTSDYVPITARGLTIMSGGTDYGIELRNTAGDGGHIISTSASAGHFYVYGNRAKSQRPFVVRSHSNKDSYRNDFWIEPSGSVHTRSDLYSGSNLRLNGANTFYNINNMLYLTGETGVRLRGNRAGTSLYITNDSIGNRIYSIDIYNRTYSGSANAHITSAGTLGRSTSATKYKININDVDIGDLSDSIVELRPKSWYDKESTEAYSRYITLKNAGIVDSADYSDIPYIEKHLGFIAEDLIELGFSSYVDFGAPNKDGVREVEGIKYDRLWIPLLPKVKELQEIIRNHEDRIEILEKTILNK